MRLVRRRICGGRIVEGDETTGSVEYSDLMFDNAQIFSLRMNEQHLSSHFERMPDVRILRFKSIM
jgi:hypothetical protein